MQGNFGGSAPLRGVDVSATSGLPPLSPVAASVLSQEGYCVARRCFASSTNRPHALGETLPGSGGLEQLGFQECGADTSGNNVVATIKQPLSHTNSCVARIAAVLVKSSMTKVVLGGL